MNPASTGAQALVGSLERLGVQHIFGIPGGAILPAYDALLDSGIRHILVRHEQAAGHAAQGYAAATGLVGVCMATSGPGATNLVTPLADAYMDSVGIVAITGQVGTRAIGTDAFQEADIRGITMPVTKHSFHVHDAGDIPNVIAEAFHIASTGRPGPVLVELTKTALQSVTWNDSPSFLHLPGYRPAIEPSPGQVERAVELLRGAQRPVLYVGGGVVRADASAALSRLVEATGIPVVTTLMALGAFPASHPLHLGMPGMHGTVAAVGALQKADLIVALGARFDNRVTGDPGSFAPHARVIHVDIDPAEIGKNRRVDVEIVADCRLAIEALVNQVRSPTTDEGVSRSLGNWHAFVGRLQEAYPVGYSHAPAGGLAPQYVLERLAAACDERTIFTSGVGQHQMWAAHFLRHERPRAWVNSGGLGTMGFGVPAAMGAKVACPDATVWAVDGDGCFQMTNQELATCALNNIPIKVALINNQSLGMVRQLQSLYYGGRTGHVSLGPSSSSRPIPDFALLSEALGAVGMVCEHPEDVDQLIHKAMQIDDTPVVIDFRVQQEAMVWPAIPDGAGNDAIQYARNLAPSFEADDL